MKTYSDFQTELASNPQKGDVIPGGAPVRKIRWGDKRRGMGKRGGLRVIYLPLPEPPVLLLLDVYGKDEADDLSESDKKILQALAKQFVSQVQNRYSGGTW